jgi:precorrin-6Y C5,15-methyltransferase (decarboxylating)
MKVLEDIDITSISVAKAKEVGNYHMMTGQNPIYIISTKG